MAKKRRFPFGFGFGDFDGIFEEMERRMEENMRGFGVSIRIGPDGKPVVSTFGNRPVMEEKKGKKVISEEREPLVDVIEGKDTLTVIAEVPGVSRDDIKLTGEENKLEISVDTPSRKYHKAIRLPCDVKPMSTKASYKNGVLEVVLERMERKKDEGTGKRIKID
jgi:HSP20 family protein